MRTHPSELKTNSLSQGGNIYYNPLVQFYRMTKGRVLVGLSGGLDSTVAALLLQREGYDVIGVHLKLWSDNKAPDMQKNLPENKCCSVRDLMLARTAAKKMNIPFYVFDFRDCFKREVVDEFLERFKMGITPNPCVECNRNIKFGYFLKKMKELGADYVATGHYCQNTWNAKTKKWEFRRGNDGWKDQSYFLYTLTQDKLAHALFPVGHLDKDKVRTIALENGFEEFAVKKESQGVCFFPEANHIPFLMRHLPETLFQKGPLIIKKTNEKVGEHEGLLKYTIGQRARVGGFEHPMYVLSNDLNTNTVFIGDDAELLTSTLSLKQVTWTMDDPGNNAEIEIRVRHGGKPQKVRVLGKGDERRVEFFEPIRAITPGQSAVFSDGDLCLGGGIIVN